MAIQSKEGNVQSLAEPVSSFVSSLSTASRVDTFFWKSRSLNGRCLTAELMWHVRASVRTKEDFLSLFFSNKLAYARTNKRENTLLIRKQNVNDKKRNGEEN